MHGGSSDCTFGRVTNVVQSCLSQFVTVNVVTTPSNAERAPNWGRQNTQSLQAVLAVAPSKKENTRNVWRFSDFVCLSVCLSVCPVQFVFTELQSGSNLLLGVPSKPKSCENSVAQRESVLGNVRIFVCVCVPLCVCVHRTFSLRSRKVVQNLY